MTDPNNLFPPRLMKILSQIPGMTEQLHSLGIELGNPMESMLGLITGEIGGYETLEKAAEAVRHRASVEDDDGLDKIADWLDKLGAQLRDGVGGAQ